MRWIVTKDHHGGCIGLGEDADGVPARGKPEDGDALPIEFRLYTARGRLLFEGRCGDIAADWWHGMEPLLYTWTTFRCRRLCYRRAGTKEQWRPLRPEASQQTPRQSQRGRRSIGPAAVARARCMRGTAKIALAGHGPARKTKRRRRQQRSYLMRQAQTSAA